MHRHLVLLFEARRPSWPCAWSSCLTSRSPLSSSLREFGSWLWRGDARRDTYLKIKVKIKHLQKLKLNIFPVKIKHSLDKKFSKFDKKWKSFCKILRKFGFRAVQRVLNLVDLKKCWKMSIWTQKSALIQKRTSPPKFFNFIWFSYPPGI